MCHGRGDHGAESTLLDVDGEACSSSGPRECDRSALRHVEDPAEDEGGVVQALEADARADDVGHLVLVDGVKRDLPLLVLR